MMVRRGIAALATAAATLVALSGCVFSGLAEQNADEFGAWLRTQPHILTVDAGTQGGEWGSHGLLADVRLDPAITGPELVDLSKTIWEYVTVEKGSAFTYLHFTIGNTFGFSIDQDGSNAAVLSALRDDGRFTGGYVDLEPGGPSVHETVATVPDQSTVAEAYPAVIDILRQNQAQLTDETILIHTEDDAFSIQGEISDDVIYTVDGTDKVQPAYEYSPAEAVQLAADIGAAVPISNAHASAGQYSGFSLEVGVAAVDQPTARQIASAHPTIVLTFE